MNRLCHFRLFGLATATILMLASTPGVTAGIYDTWPKKMKVTFAGYNKPETLTNFPALIVFSNAMFSGFSYGDFQSLTNQDLRFANSNETTALNYEIDTWNTNGTSYVWVQVPVLTNNATVWATWGNTAYNSQASYTTNGATWKPAYQGVWHLQNNGNAITVINSVSGLVGTNNLGASVATNGVVDGGAGCYAAASGLGSADEVALRTTKTLTLSAWVLPTTLTTGNNAIINKRGGGDPYNYSLWMKTNGQTFFQFNNGAGNATDTGPAYKLNEWVMTSVIINENLSSGKLSFLGNGVIRSQPSYPGGMAPGSDSLSFGSFYPVGTGYQLKGGIDEVRISTNALSTNWVWATYQNMASNTMFQSYGAVVTPSASTPINTTPLLFFVQ